jgi:hypothetical protein
MSCSLQGSGGVIQVTWKWVRIALLGCGIDHKAGRTTGDCLRSTKLGRFDGRLIIMLLYALQHIMLWLFFFLDICDGN